MNKTLYQLNSNGKVKVWTIKVVKISDQHFDIYITHGQQDGKMQDDITPITEGKNIGKKNETSVYEQAVKDAETEFNKKIKKGYVEDISKIKKKGETRTINAPMKGETYHPKGKEMKAMTLDDLGIKGKKVGIQYKLDGHRYRLKISRSEVIFYSSSGDIVPSFEHIENSLKECLNNLITLNPLVFMSYFSGGEIILDGEIYNHQLGFQTVASACGTRVHITEEKQKLRDQMQFHLFDICLDLPFSERYELIQLFEDSKNIWVVPIDIVVAEDDIIEEYFQKFLKRGYEGLMIRQLDMPYQYKRTKQLIKYKPFIDGEYKIIGFKKSITGETLGSFECEFSNGGKFFANPMEEVGTDEAKQEIWNNKESYLGKWLNCRFMDYTDEGLPRHPRARYFRKGKSKD